MLLGLRTLSMAGVASRPLSTLLPKKSRVCWSLVLCLFIASDRPSPRNGSCCNLDFVGPGNSKVVLGSLLLQYGEPPILRRTIKLNKHPTSFVQKTCPLKPSRTIPVSPPDRFKTLRLPLGQFGMHVSGKAHQEQDGRIMIQKSRTTDLWNPPWAITLLGPMHTAHRRPHAHWRRHAHGGVHPWHQRLAEGCERASELIPRVS